MSPIHDVTEAISDGWHTHQQLLIDAIAPLGADELALRAAPHLRSVEENALHIIAARAYWFHRLMGEGGQTFKSLSKWDEGPSRSADELIQGLEQTWQGMHEAIDSWNDDDWQKTWPARPGSAPAVITREWVIWHLIEHDLHHSGEIALTLGMHGIAALSL